MTDQILNALSAEERGLITTALATMKKRNSRTASDADTVKGASIEAQDAFHAHNAAQQQLIDELIEKIHDASEVYIEPPE